CSALRLAVGSRRHETSLAARHSAFHQKTWLVRKTGRRSVHRRGLSFEGFLPGVPSRAARPRSIPPRLQSDGRRTASSPALSRSRESSGSMGNRLYVGNLSFSTTQQTIETAFAAAGEVREVAMPT